MRILCLFGIHSWEYFKAPWRVRKCTKCLKLQTASYDMSYGETIWKNFNRMRLKPSNPFCKCKRKDDFYRMNYCLNCGGRNCGI